MTSSVNVHSVSYDKRGANPGRMEAVREHAGRSILDVGCGNGTYVLQLAGEYDIRGVDFSRYDTWQKMPERFAVATADRLDMPDGSVETVLSFETLEHLEEPLRALKEYHRVCSKNVVLTVPNCDITSGMRQSGLTYYHWVDRTHVQFFNLETIAALVAEAGFTVEKKYYINEISIVPMAAEMFGLSGFALKVWRRLAARSQKKRYFMTCLVVGKKK